MCWDCWTNTRWNRNWLTTFRTDCAALHQVNTETETNLAYIRYVDPFASVCNLYQSNFPAVLPAIKQLILRRSGNNARCDILLQTLQLYTVPFPCTLHLAVLSLTISQATKSWVPAWERGYTVYKHFDMHRTPLFNWPCLLCFCTLCA